MIGFVCNDERRSIMELKYTANGDYFLPLAEAPCMPPLGKYGIMRKEFLRTHQTGIYTGMLLSGSLTSHLMEVDKSAQEMMTELVQQLAYASGITESMKAQDQMKWVRMMNAVTNQAEEIVLNELIYA